MNNFIHVGAVNTTTQINETRPKTLISSPPATVALTGQIFVTSSTTIPTNLNQTNVFQLDTGHVKVSSVQMNQILASNRLFCGSSPNEQNFLLIPASTATYSSHQSQSPTNNNYIGNRNQLTRRPLHKSTNGTGPKQTIRGGKRPSKACRDCGCPLNVDTQRCAKCDQKSRQQFRMPSGQIRDHPFVSIERVGTLNASSSVLRFDVHNPLLTTRLHGVTNHNASAKVTHYNIPASSRSVPPPQLTKYNATDIESSSSVIDLVDETNEECQKKLESNNSLLNTNSNDNANNYDSPLHSLSTLTTSSSSSTTTGDQGEKLLNIQQTSERVQLPCRSVRFGSYRTVPFKEGFTMGQNGITLVVKEDCDEQSLVSSQSSSTANLQRKPFALTMSWRHVRRVEYLLNQQISVIFLIVNEYAAKKIRETFNLTNCNVDDDRLPYFDPESKLVYHKFITVILSSKEREWLSKLTEFVDKASEEHSISIDVVELLFAKGNKQLSDSVPPSAKHLFNSRSSSTPLTSPPNASQQIVRQPKLENGNKNYLIESRKRSQHNYSTVGNTLKRLRSDDLFDDVTSPSLSTVIKTYALSRRTRATNASTSSTITSIVDSPVRRTLTANIKKEDKEHIKLFVFPSSSESNDCIAVSKYDLNCLEPDEFLNDTIIDFYLKYVLLRVLTEEQRAKTHIFNSFFWHKLTTKQRNAAADSPTRQHRAVQQHRRVRTWTKNVNIFEKDFIVIPINENAHWFLAIICYPGLAEPVYDSVINTSNACSDDVVSNCATTESDEVKSSLDDVKSSPGDVKSSPDVKSTQDDDLKGTILSSGSSPLVTPSDAPVDPDDDDEDREEAKEERKQWELGESSQKPNSHSILRKTKLPCIVVMDSLWAGSSKYRTVTILRDYLSEEYASKYVDSTRRVFDRTTFKGFYPKVPQQDNYSDCGVYVLQYAECFLTRPPDDYSAAGLKNMQNWFSLESVKTKRKEIGDLMMKLADEYSEDKKPDDDEGGDFSSPDFSP